MSNDKSAAVYHPAVRRPTTDGTNPVAPTPRPAREAVASQAPREVDTPVRLTVREWLACTAAAGAAIGVAWVFLVVVGVLFGHGA